MKEFYSYRLSVRDDIDQDRLLNADRLTQQQMILIGNDKIKILLEPKATVA